VQDYYAQAAQVIGWEGRFTHDLSKPTGMTQKLVSVARLEAFGWTATTSLSDGLARTYAHFKEHHA
jgi:GDP-L-fucose synthase